MRQGGEFRVCPEAKIPLSTADQRWHEWYGFFTAAFTFAIVFGAFAANVLLRRDAPPCPAPRSRRRRPTA